MTDLLAGTAASDRLRLDDTMVVFDWNGTVVVDADRARASLNAVLGKRGVPPLDPQEFSRNFRLPMAEMFGDLGVTDDGAAAEAEWNEQMTSVTTALRAGASSALSRLADDGAWLAVVSAASADAVRFDLRSLSVPPVWRRVDAPVSDKRQRLQLYRHERRQAFYVGDTAYDMHAASAAGFTAIGVVGGYAAVDVLRAAGAERIIDSLDELIEVVAER